MANSKKRKPQTIEDEINNINKNIINTEAENYQLTQDNRKIVGEIAEIFLANKEVKNLISDYVTNLDTIAKNNNLNANRRTDLNYKIEKLNEEEKSRCEFKYITIKDANYPVGLFNTVCLNPVAMCKHHNVFLSDRDIEFKKCFNHSNGKVCKHLIVFKNDENENIPLQK